MTSLKIFVRKIVIALKSIHEYIIVSIFKSFYLFNTTSGHISVLCHSCSYTEHIFLPHITKFCMQIEDVGLFFVFNRVYMYVYLQWLLSKIKNQCNIYIYIYSKYYIIFFLILVYINLSTYRVAIFKIIQTCKTTCYTKLHSIDLFEIEEYIFTSSFIIKFKDCLVVN